MALAGLALRDELPATAMGALSVHVDVRLPWDEAAAVCAAQGARLAAAPTAAKHAAVIQALVAHNEAPLRGWRGWGAWT